MLTFFQWLLAESRQSVSPDVLKSYERAFADQLKELIQRTINPVLRARLQDMIDCPFRDSRGQCRGFAEYIVSALVRAGVADQHDIEASLAYVIEKMLLDKSDTGEPRASLFGGFAERPDYIGGNPLQARFLKYLTFAVNNIRKGKIARLSNVERRPQGTVSIGVGRNKGTDPTGEISPDKIAARPSGDADLTEMLDDIKALLRRKEAAYGLPVVSFFTSMMSGARMGQHVQRFGDSQVRMMRNIITQTVEEYGQVTGNYSLLNLLQRLQAGGSEQTKAVPKPQPQMPKLSDQQRDYGSIMSVVDRLGGRPVGSADLGRYRRRWLDYPPRDPASGHQNRMAEVLARMVQDGALTATKTRQGAFVYVPGPKANAYRHVTMV